MIENLNTLVQNFFTAPNDLVLIGVIGSILFGLYLIERLDGDD